MAEFCTEIKPALLGILHIRCVAQGEFAFRTLPRLIFELLPIDSNRWIESCEKRIRQGREAHCRGLMSDECLTIHVEVVEIGLAAENWVIVQDQTGALAGCAVALQEKSGRKAADAPADDYAVELLASVVNVLARAGKDAIANSVAICHHLVRVAVRITVIADAAVSGPVVF